MTNTPTNQVAEIKPAVDDSFEKLSAVEVQALRAMMEKNRDGRSKSFQVPELPISEQDKDLFAECLCEGKPFKEAFSRYNGKLVVELRSKVKWEEDMIIEQVRKDFAERYTQTDGQYVNRLNLYNLAFELVKLDGVVQPTINKGTNLREFIERSVLEGMSEPKLYILITLMAQFDFKVSRLCRIALPDFSVPEVAS